MNTREDDDVERGERIPLLANARNSLSTSIVAADLKQARLRRQVKKLRQVASRRNCAIFIYSHRYKIVGLLFLGTVGVLMGYYTSEFSDIHTHKAMLVDNESLMFKLYQNSSCPPSSFFFHPEADYSWTEKEPNYEMTYQKNYHEMPDYCDGSNFAKSIISSLSPEICSSLVLQVCALVHSILSDEEQKGDLVGNLLLVSMIFVAVCGPASLFGLRWLGKIGKRDREVLEGVAAECKVSISVDAFNNLEQPVVWDGNENDDNFTAILKQLERQELLLECSQIMEKFTGVNCNDMTNLIFEYVPELNLGQKKLVSSKTRAMRGAFMDATHQEKNINSAAGRFFYELDNQIGHPKYKKTADLPSGVVKRIFGFVGPG